MSDFTRTILLTGASGALGGHLFRRLMESGVPLRLLTYDLADAAKFAPLPPENIHRFGELGKGTKIIPEKSVVIHAGFARTSDGKALAASIDSTQRLFTAAVRDGAAGIINISSQSVYSPVRVRPARESDVAAPSDLYGIAKFACERLGESITANSATKFTTLRLGSLIGPEYPERILFKFLIQLLNQKNLKIIGGRQIFSLLDVRDAAEAIFSFWGTPLEKWKKIYNLGNPDSITIMTLARRTAEVVRRVTGFQATIELERTTLEMNSSLNSDEFRATTGWTPRYTLEDTIDAILQVIKKK